MSKRSNIEQKYRETFGEDIKREEWNTPDPELWQGISSRIETKRERSSVIPILLLIILILGTASVLLYIQLNDVNERIAQEAVKQQNSSKLSAGTLNENLGNIDKDHDGFDHRKGSTINTDRVFVSEFDVLDNSEIYSPISGVVDISSISLTASKDDVPRLSNNRSISVGRSSINENPLSRYSEPSSSIKEIHIDILELPMNFNYLTLPERDLTNPALTEVPNDLKVVSEDANTYLSVDLLANSTSLVTSGVQVAPLTELIGEQYMSNPISVGMNIVHPISNKLFLSTGVNYTKNTLHTKYDLQLEYRHQDETINGASGSIAYSHSLPSAVGDVNTDLILARSLNSSINDVEKVNLDFDTKTDMHEIGIPIRFCYFLMEQRRGFNFGFNIIPLYILTHSTKVGHVISHHDLILETSSDASRTTFDGDRFQFQSGVQIGYNLAISEVYSINLLAQYQRRLTNLFESQDFSSSTESLSLGLSISGTF